MSKNKTFVIKTTLLFSILYVFHIPLSFFLNWFLVDPIVSKIASDCGTDISLSVLLLSLIYFLYNKTGRDFLLKLSFVSLIIYLATRWLELWDFTEFRASSSISYYDATFIALILPGIAKNLIHIAKLAFRRNLARKEQRTDVDGFIEDNPINNIEGDQFNRSLLAQEIAKLIQLTKTKKSFAIGVNGEYGSGKTSFLNLLEKSLEITNENSIFIIHFNSWESDSVKELQAQFFEQLIEKISAIDPSLSSLMFSYFKKLVNSDSSLAGVTGRLRLVSHFLFDQPIDEKHSINESLEKTEKKIIVFIDDVDRLHTDEIIEVLRLIRNTANFRNFFYIVAYDRNYVIDALQQVNKVGTLSYLEKIFQLEIPLPKFDELELYGLLQNQIKKVVDLNHFEEFKENILPRHFDHPYEANLDGLFTSGRDITRFINSMLVTYKLIKDEVVFKDYFFNQVLKFKYPVVYDLIYEQRNKFLDHKPFNFIHEERYFLRQESDDKSSIIHFLLTTHKSLYSDKELYIVEILLKELYPDFFNTVKRPRESISNPEFFPVYYRHHLGKMVLSERIFRIEMKSGSVSIKSYIDDCFHKNLETELLQRLMIEEKFTLQHDFEKYLRSVFYFGSKYTEKKGIMSFPYDKIINKLKDLSGDIVKNAYNGDKIGYKKFIVRLLDNEKSNYSYFFLNQLVFELKSRNSISTFGEVDFFTRLQISYFKDMITSTHCLNSKVVWMFWGLRNFDYNDQEGGEVSKLGEFVPEAIDVLKENLDSCNLSDFLRSLIEQNFYEEKMFMIPEVILYKVFNNPHELKETVKRNVHTSDEIIDEFLNFFERFEANSFKSVSYVFKTELKK